jgi:hypothetical protein
MFGKKKSDRERIENARVGYQAALSLFVADGGLVWSMFNAMLVFQSIILSGIVLAMVASTAPKCGAFLIAWIMSVVGMIISCLWWKLISRTFTYRNYWIVSARELEKTANGFANVLVRGKDFAEGKEVVVDGESLRIRSEPLIECSKVLAKMKAFQILLHVKPDLDTEAKPPKVVETMKNITQVILVVYFLFFAMNFSLFVCEMLKKL